MVAVAPLCAPSRSGQRLSGLHRSLREACTLPARVWVHKVLLAVLIGCVTALVLTATTQTVRGNSRGSTWGRETSSSGVHFAAANTRYLHQSTNSLGIPGTPRSKHEHPSCAFLRSTNQQTAQRMFRTSNRVCMDDSAMRWLRRSRSNCYSCTYPDRNMCTATTKIIYHMSLNHLHPTNSQGNLLAIQAYLMTQDLSRSRLIMWVLDRDQVYTNTSAWLFDAFSDHVSIQQFDYKEAIKGTVWEHDAFFGNHTLVQQYVTNAACYSDLMRMLILHRYGGLWVDNDVIFYQDLTHMMRTSYQFVMRPVNNHIMRMEAGSALTHRMLQLATTMPMNHPNFKEEIVDGLCTPIGYEPIMPEVYGFMDIYNFCLFRLLLRQNNTGRPDAVLYDLPIGWFDHDWEHCFGTRKHIGDSKWERVASSYLCMHNRYPRIAELGPEGSPLRRVISIIQDFFEACRSTDCLPVQGLPLLVYEGLHDQPPGTRRRLLSQLRQQAALQGLALEDWGEQSEQLGE